VALTSAAAQIVLGLAGVGFTTYQSEVGAIVWLELLQIVVWGATGAALVLGAGRDSRILALGTVLLLAASSFAYPRAAVFEAVHLQIVAFLVFLKNHLREDAFIPAALWLFARDFPKDLSPSSLRRRIERAIHCYVVLAILLIVANLLLALSPQTAESRLLSMLTVVSVDDEFSHYWSLVEGSCIFTLLFMVWKARRAPLDEKRRVLVFTLGLAIGLGPTALYLLFSSVIPGLTPALRENGWFSIILTLLLVLLLAAPITTAYSIFVDRVLDVRIILRGAFQYGFARSTVAAVAFLPFGSVGVYLFQMRNETLASVFSGRSLSWVAAGAVVGGLLLSTRKFAENGIDRLFFRERYDARRILLSLVERSPQAVGGPEFGELVLSELERAFHPERVGLFVADASHRAFLPISHFRRELEESSELAYLLTLEGQPIAVDLEDTTSKFRQLSDSERQWLADSQFHLLVPVLGSGRKLEGIIGLGERRSQLPYNAEDKAMLRAVSAAVGIRLEWLRRSGRSGNASLSVDELGKECPRCFSVHDAWVEKCSGCRGGLVSTVIPKDLLGKFRLEKRIGQGAMGIVYQAIDMALNRPVAIKTLPRTSPEDAVALRREARAMAGIQHPHLAMIFGAESWNGYPLLVLEFLERGTLAERLQNDMVPISDVIDLGIAISGALQKTHTSGLLHGDVKPSNIGFTGAGVPKLMDFGLARLYRRVPAGVGYLTSGLEVDVSRFSSRYGGGTLVYMSPEAISGAVPEPAFDLWSLALVLYEALAGQNPFERENAETTRRAILDADLPDIRDLRPDCPPLIAGFFRCELSRNALDRAQTGKQFRFRMRAVEKELRRLAGYAEDSMKKT
jgi:hypothetical protein